MASRAIAATSNSDAAYARPVVPVSVAPFWMTLIACPASPTSVCVLTKSDLPADIASEVSSSLMAV